MPTSTTEPTIVLGDAGTHRSPEGDTEARSSTVEATLTTFADAEMTPSNVNMPNESIIALSCPVDGATEDGDAADFDIFEDTARADDAQFAEIVNSVRRAAERGPPPLEDERVTLNRLVFQHAEPPRGMRRRTRPSNRDRDRDTASSYADDGSVSRAETCASRSSAASVVSDRAQLMRAKRHEDREAKTQDIFETWSRLIMKRDGDLMIMAEACLLAQFSNRAFRRLNNLIHTWSIRSDLDNPAGKLHSDMQKIRHDIEEEMGIATTQDERVSSRRQNIHHLVDASLGTRPANQTGPSHSRDDEAWRGHQRSSDARAGGAWSGDHRSSNWGARRGW